MPRKHRVAWVSIAQFDPRLRVGALFTFLARLRFLQEQGHVVSILDFLPHGGNHAAFDRALVEAGGTALARDGGLCRTSFRGVPYSHQVLPVSAPELSTCYQVVVKAVRDALGREEVDRALASDQGYWAVLAAWQAQIPVAHFFHTLGNVKAFVDNPGYARLLSRCTVISNSQFLRSEIKARLGLDAEVWYPFVECDAYRVTREEQRAGKIGFYSAGRNKGSAIVAAIARRMPERRFLVVGRYDEPTAENVTVWGYIPDMRQFYREIDLLLAPSVWPEPYGRVVVEAAANGIPSIANRIGGLPEALGDSGLLIDVDPDVEVMANCYVDAIRLLDDPRACQDYRDQALARAATYEREQQAMSLAFMRRHIA